MSSVSMKNDSKISDGKSEKDSIVLTNLTKQYKGTSKPALSNMSLMVKRGEVYGFLGPNGAGKSTAIKLLMDFIRPTSGNARILGFDCIKKSLQIKQRVGYLSGDIAMYPNMTGRQFLEYMQDLQPMESTEYRDELLRRLRAEPTKKLGELSRGNRQKIAIVQAFMHKPDVLILDEPTSGLDPLMQEVFYELVLEAKNRQAIVFMSSHIMGEVQKTCDRVGIIRDGKLVHEFVVSELLDSGGQIFDVTFAGAPPIKLLGDVRGLKIISEDQNTVVMNIKGELSPFFAILASHKVLKIKAHSSDLDDLFMQYYKEGDGKS